MKITLNTNAFTLAEKASAKEFINEWNWISNDEVENEARHALNDIKSSGWKMSSHGLIECCKDHYEPCIWANDVVMIGDNTVAIVSLNLTDAINTPYEDRPHCYRRIYKLDQSECV